MIRRPPPPTTGAGGPVGSRSRTTLRRVAVALWGLALLAYIVFIGLPLDRASLVLWALLGVAAASIGRGRTLAAVLDFVPYGLVLVAYDYLRGLSSTLGMPTHWYATIKIDKALFFGHLPTVWLQGLLKYPTPQWWEIPVSFIYVSYFVLFAFTGAVLWLRSRRDFYRWSYRFIPLCLIAFTFFALTPAAPPWAAARCTPADVVGNPTNPPCMSTAPRAVPNALIGPLTVHHAGAHPYVERLSGRGLHILHVVKADALLHNGQQIGDAVAAVPSMHSAGVMLFAIFMWRRVRRRWRPLLALYPIAMGFVLVYSGEHYVTDILLGWLAAVVVSVVAGRAERRWEARRTRREAADLPTGGRARRALTLRT